MHISDLRIQLPKAIFEASVAYLAKMQERLSNETIYGFNIYCNSGFDGIYGAVATVESLEKTITLIYQNNPPSPEAHTEFELAVSEWPYLMQQAQIFTPVNNLIKAFFKTLSASEEAPPYSSEEDRKQLFATSRELIAESIVTALNQVKSEGYLDSGNFKKDVFLGLQFSDGGKENLAKVVKASAKVNSEQWHQKVVWLQKRNAEFGA